jgi:PAS domain S-box-containing protein
MTSTPNSAVPELSRKIVELRGLSRASTLVGLAMLTVIGLISIWSLRQMDATGSWVSHTYQVISSTNQLLLDVKNAETAARAYLLQPLDRYRSDFYSASGRVPDDLTKIRSLTADNTRQQERLSELLPLLSRRIQKLAEIISVRGNSDLADSERIREELGTKQDAEAIAELCRQVQNEEYRLLEERQRIRRARLIQGFIATLGSLFLALVALLISSGQVRRAIGDLIESDRRRREYETMAASLFEAAPESILVVDKKGTIRKANPETEQLFGYSPDEISDQAVEMLVPDRLRNDCAAFRQRFLSDDVARSAGRKFEISLLRKNGAEFSAEVSVGYLRTNDESLAVAFTSDVTQRRADEQAIKAYTQELQQLAGKLMTAQEDERRRIARDLHDDLNQKLAFLAMDLGRLMNKEELGGMRVELKSLQQKARQAADFVRGISHQLHPAVLEDLGLESALEEFCHEFQDRSGIATTFECADVPENIPVDLASSVYYVVAECLRNVAKHARAPSVSVRLALEAMILRLEVVDDGIGIAQYPEKPPAGIGIVAMRERLHLFRGSIEIRPADGRGTRVSVKLPLSK